MYTTYNSGDFGGKKLQLGGCSKGEFGLRFQVFIRIVYLCIARWLEIDLSQNKSGKEGRARLWGQCVQTL